MSLLSKGFLSLISKALLRLELFFRLNWTRCMERHIFQPLFCPPRASGVLTAKYNLKYCNFSCTIKQSNFIIINVYEIQAAAWKIQRLLLFRKMTEYLPYNPWIHTLTCSSCMASPYCSVHGVLCLQIIEKKNSCTLSVLTALHTSTCSSVRH